MPKLDNSFEITYPELILENIFNIVDYLKRMGVNRVKATPIEDVFSMTIIHHKNIKMPEIKVRKMKTRWGSCIPSKNKITLNIALIYVPKECMEYVVLHELVHFLEPNHGKRFYGIIEEYMTDYKEIRKKLNREYGNIL